jgi:hypothetical protein
MRAPSQRFIGGVPDEGGDEGIGRCGVRAMGLISLADAPALDDHDAVAQRHGFHLIVSDIDHGGLQALL